MLAVLSSSLLAWDQSIDQALASDVCTIDRFDDLTQAEFLQRYDGVRPVILTGRRSVNTLLRTLTLRKRLIREHGSMEVSITTMDARGFRDTMRTSLRVYLESFMRPVAGVRDGERVWYLFADLDKFDDSTRIHEDFAEYQPPHDLQRHEPTCGPRQESPCYARNAYYNQFGIGGRGSGVPFHLHGEGWNEVLHGSKRFFLHPPNSSVPLHFNPVSDSPRPTAGGLCPHDVPPWLTSVQLLVHGIPPSHNGIPALTPGRSWRRRPTGP